MHFISIIKFSYTHTHTHTQNSVEILVFFINYINLFPLSI